MSGGRAWVLSLSKHFKEGVGSVNDHEPTCPCYGGGHLERGSFYFIIRHD